jgi:hypothetical protein
MMMNQERKNEWNDERQRKSSEWKREILEFFHITELRELKVLKCFVSF